MKSIAMKRMILLLLLSTGCLGGAWAAYQAVAPAAPPPAPLSHFIPPGALLYLQAKDFTSLLGEWNASPQKRQWLASSNYEVFSKSRLFLRLNEASEQFTAAAGLPPDMNFLGEMAGGQSALAIYDIGKLQFLYITRRAPAVSMQSALWQTRSKFEVRNTGSAEFYVRRDPESQREVAFAVDGDYLLLATREDLIASALQLLQGGQGATIEVEPWWAGAVAVAGPEGDLRMALNLEKIVPSPYFRSYWIQQNITDLKQYRASISDLFRSGQEYREERALLKVPASSAGTPAAGDSAAVADLVRLAPADGGVYEVQASPTPDASYRLIDAKILSPHAGPASAQQTAPQVQLSSGESGNSADMETRIDQAPVEKPSAGSEASALKALLGKAAVRAILQVQSTESDKDGVFVRMHSGIAMLGSSDWNEAEVHASLVNLIGPALTAGGLGVNWSAKPGGYQEIDGLWPLSVAVRGKYLLISDNGALLSSMLANMNQKVVSQPALLIAGFSHQRERQNFKQLTGLIDRPNAAGPADNGANAGRAPQLFSDNISSLSSTLAGVSAEKVVIRDAGDKTTQTVTYTWTR
jgi:hypothetical protein